MGKCIYCGCTDGRACVGGCGWILPNVCSNCVITTANSGREIKAYMEDPDTEKIEIVITDKKKAVSKFK